MFPYISIVEPLAVIILGVDFVVVCRLAFKIEIPIVVWAVVPFTIADTVMGSSAFTVRGAVVLAVILFFIAFEVKIAVANKVVEEAKETSV